MKSNRRSRRVKVSADGTGLVSRAGTLLLRELTVDTGLVAGWTEVLLDTYRAFPTRHAPGRVLADLAVTIADGGDALTHLAGLRDQGKLFGPVASEPTAWRAVARVDEAHLVRLRAVRAAARDRAWAAGAGPDIAAGLTIDLDATITVAHSEKDNAAKTWKKTFGFHPLLAYLDRPAGEGPVVLVRTDAAGATHVFAAALRERGCVFSLGFAIDETVQAAVLAVPETEWTPARNIDGEPRDGAWLAEVTDAVNLTAWPAGSRLIVRRERPHPGAQMRFTDADGHRFTAFLTDTTDSGPLADLEARHRCHARVEDRIRAAKATGLRNLPCRGYAQNKVWLELSLAAADLLTWAQALCFTGHLARCEPAAFRYRVCAVAGRLVRTGRSWQLRLDRDWPWARHLQDGYIRLRAAPWPA